MSFVESATGNLFEVCSDHLAFTQAGPRLAAIDPPAVVAHPFADFLEHFYAAIIERTVRQQGYADACIAITRGGFDDVADHDGGVIVETGSVEPIAHRTLGDPRLFGVDVAWNAEFLGGDGAVGRLAEFDDAEGIDLAAAFQRLVVKVGDDALHGVRLDAGAGVESFEGLLAGAVGIDEIRVILIDGVSHAGGPPGGVPLGVVEVLVEDACLGRTVWRVCGVVHGLVFPQIDIIEHAGIQTLPPLALAVGESEVPVIRDACFRAGLVAAEGGLPPPP